MSIITDVIHPGSKGTIVGFKKMTCLTKTEDVLFGQNGSMLDQKQYVFKLATLQNDMGFGAKTGDLVEAMNVVSMNPKKFETGKKYWVEFKAE